MGLRSSIGGSPINSQPLAGPASATNLRAARRAIVLGLLLLFCFARWLLMRLHGPDTLERRAQWLHKSGVLVMRRMGIPLKVTGTPPARGLLVANHLTYLDILIFGTALPCYLVSKAEISRWPFLGTLARAGGTLFVDRSSRASAESVTDQIAERLKGNVPVLFFPEGTSTDGSQLLRFHSRFYTPAVVAGVPVTAAAVRYVFEDGTPERELCWPGDEAFLSHIWRDLRAPNFSAEVHFGEPRIYTDRRTAADATYAEIEAMRNAKVLTVQ
jgi:1-acyl-sn-glycerol-3-phosphate acyltransferase